jgi:GrpB-like predicted nucleotidyltransferase (UPF0157 family)
MLAMVSGPPAVVYQDYDPGDAPAFARLASAIHAVLPAARVEHVGSTSVPRLGGRPIIDAVVIDAVDAHQAIIAALLAAGFMRRPFAWIGPTLTTSLRVDAVSYPVLLYALDKEHPMVRGWLATRDHWRAHPDEADRYAQIKRASWPTATPNPGSTSRPKPYLQQLARQLSQPDGSERFPRAPRVTFWLAIV